MFCLFFMLCIVKLIIYLMCDIAHFCCLFANTTGAMRTKVAVAVDTILRINNLCLKIIIENIFRELPCPVTRVQLGGKKNIISHGEWQTFSSRNKSPAAIRRQLWGDNQMKNDICTPLCESVLAPPPHFPPRGQRAPALAVTVNNDIKHWHGVWQAVAHW